MARYKPVDPHLSKMLPVRFSDQILPDTFEYAVHWLVDHEINQQSAQRPPASGCTFNSGAFLHGVQVGGLQVVSLVDTIRG